MALRWKERRVRFREHSIERQHRGYIAHRLHFGIGDVTGERDHEAHIDSAPCVFNRAGEAMEDAAQAGGAPGFVDDLQAIGPGVAAVDDDGELGRAGLVELAPEDLLLHLARRVVVVIVEANLAPGDYARMFR